MKKLNSLFAILLIVMSLGCKDQDVATIETVTPEEMQAILDIGDVQLVDVRTPDELLDEGFIPKAQNIDFNSPTFAQDISKLDKSKPVVLYCHSGGRSAKCAKKLKEAGFVKIYDLQGGISEWKHKGYMVEYLDD